MFIQSMLEVTFGNLPTNIFFDVNFLTLQTPPEKISKKNKKEEDVCANQRPILDFDIGIKKNSRF